MAEIILKGHPVNTVGELPAVGSTAPEFQITGIDFSEINSSDFAGNKLILNIFPSVDTGVCAMSVRTFNQKAASVPDAQVICISRDLPLALGRFCGAEGIEEVVVGSDFRTNFGELYGVTFADGPFKGMLSRSVVVIDADGKVVHTEHVPNTGTEPNYEAALSAVSAN